MDTLAFGDVHTTSIEPSEISVVSSVVLSVPKASAVAETSHVSATAAVTDNVAVETAELVGVDDMATKIAARQTQPVFSIHICIAELLLADPTEMQMRVKIVATSKNLRDM